MNNKKSEMIQQARRIEAHTKDIFAERSEKPVAKIIDVSDEFELQDVSNDAPVDLDVVYESRQKRPWLKLWLALAGTAIITESVLGIWQAFESSFFLGILYSGLGVLSLGIIGRLIFKEIKALIKLKRLEKVRADAERLLQSEQVGEASKWLESQLKQVSPQFATEFKTLVKSHHTDKELVMLYDTQVLQYIDNEAQQIVATSASGSALLVALSPMATLDMAAVLWRGTRMIEKISDLYGVRLGYRSRLKLYKMLLTQMVFVGGTELIADLATTSLGAELLGKLSARSAQGVSAGIFTARLGIKTMELCRPIPTFDKRPVRLHHVVKQVFKSLTSQSTTSN